MSHLRNYRSRYINKERQQKPVDIPGDKVLKYIQDCFENCAKNFAVYSPAVSCSSSSTLEQDQNEFPFESKEKEQPEPEMCVPNECNVVPCLLSPNNKDKCSGENASEDDEGPNILEDILSLGSPALLQVDEKCEEMFCSGEDQFMFDEDVENAKDVSQPEMCPSSKETKEYPTDETKCSAVSSNHNRRPESQAPLETMTTSFTHRNAASLDPEDDFEFLIEESFGMSSTSWISASQKKQKPQKKNVISAPSGSKKEANKPSARKKDKKASEKPVPPSLVNQTKLKSTNVAETIVGGLKNVSRTHEMMSLIDDQPLLVLNTFQEGRRKIHSKGMASEEISNTNPAGINQTEDHAVLLEANESTSVQSRSVLRTEEWSSNCKETVKHKHSKTKTSVERQNEENQEKAPDIMDLENNQPFEIIDTYSEFSGSVLSPILSMESAEQKSSNKNSQLAGLKSHNKKRKKQKPPRTAQSKKQPQTQGSAVKESVIRPTRRKKIVLVSDENSETEHEDERCDKEFENSYSYKLRKINNLREACQKRRQASLISSEDSDCERVSYQEDSFYLTEERLYPEKQPNSITDSSQYSSIPDVNMNNASGPLVDRKKPSKHEETFDSKEFGSDDSGDFIDSLDGFASNTLKRKLVLPTNTPNVRRTKRMRIKPLEYWRGERVKYKTRPSGGFVIHGIISPDQKEPRKPKPKKSTNPVVELDNMPESFLQGPSQPAVIFDAESNQEVLLQCVNSGTSHLHYIDNEAVSIYKYLTTPSFSAGKMILKPLKEKGYQYSHIDTLVFNITKGKLLLTLYDQYYHLTVGDYFFIPPGNVYNIRNLLNKECIILFTQLKGKRSESK